MHVSELTDDVLRDLSEVEADEPVVVSLFLNLDPSWFATPAARDSQISSLLSSLDAQIREDGLSDDAREALEADRARIEQFLQDELDAGGAEAIAVYSALALDVFRVVKLAQPVESRVHVDLRPLLEPVMGQEDEGDWCVLLVTRGTGRIFRGGPTGIRESSTSSPTSRTSTRPAVGRRRASSGPWSWRSSGTSSVSPSCCSGRSSAGRSSI